MQNKKDFSRIIKNSAKKVDDFILSNLHGLNETLWNAAKHYIEAGGKRIRPFIVMTSYALFKQEVDTVIPTAAAVEILHTFTLIHDDIMDNDDFRRNVPSVHLKWNIPTAILSGDLLYSMSFNFVNKMHLSDSIKVKLMNELSKVCVDLSEGQMMDIEFENRDDVTIEEYIEMIRLKTSSLLKTSAVLGAISANASNDEISFLAEYGEKMGLSFQIIDDILGIIADEKALGKPIGSDLKGGKKTYLILYALSHLEEPNRERLYEILSKDKKNTEEIKQGIKLIKLSGAIENAKNLADELLKDSIKALENLPSSNNREALKNLAKFTVKRDF